MKTNIFFTAFPLALKLCNYKSAKNHVFTRNKKVDTPQRIVIKKEINRNFLTLAITSTCTSQSLGCWCATNENRKITFGEIPYGLAVRIPGFHPGGPGSTPGMGKNAFFILLQ